MENRARRETLVRKGRRDPLEPPDHKDQEEIVEKLVRRVRKVLLGLEVILL